MERALDIFRKENTVRLVSLGITPNYFGSYQDDIN